MSALTAAVLRLRATVPPTPLLLTVGLLLLPTVAAGQVRIQAIHNSPYAEAALVDVYVAGVRAFDDFPFRSASAFTELPLIPPGSTLQVDVTASDAPNNSSPLFSDMITFPNGSTVIIAAGDPLNRPGAPPFALYALPGREQSETEGNMSVLIFRGVPDVPAIDVIDRLTGTKWADDVEHGNSTSSYLDLAAKPYALGVSLADDADQSLLASYLVFDESHADKAVILIASGFAEEIEPEVELMTVFPDGSVSLVAEGMDMFDARTAPNTLSNFAVEGIVLRSKGRLTYLHRDATGIAVFQSSGSFRDAVDSGEITEGDSIVVSGDRSDFSSLQQISPSNFVVLSRGHPLPEPRLLTLAEIGANGEAFESELIRVTDITIDPLGDTEFQPATTYSITDPTDFSNTVSLRIANSSDTDMDGVTIPAVLTFEGVLGQFSSSDPTAGYQLSPVNAADIEVQSGVGVEEDAELPVAFALGDAYPNPFNPSTTISYELPEPAAVSLQVFDMLGQRVRVLNAGGMPAGRHEVTFEADGLSSGIYLYRLEAGDYLASKTVVLMK